MDIILIESNAFYSLIDIVVQRIKEKQAITKDRWIDREEAMRLLHVGKTSLQKLRDSQELIYSQPMKKVILYDRISIESYIAKHSKQ